MIDDVVGFANAATSKLFELKQNYIVIRY